jgi:hypothetical protein
VYRGSRFAGSFELSLAAMRPELNAKHKIEVLKRRKAVLDALIAFIRTHPNICSDAQFEAAVEQDRSVLLRHSYRQTALGE